jgi:pyruvate/2-oxoglutarate/acetoin dehydrogenase E1 component
MGMSTGLALEGFTPITCFPRFDFLLRCMDSLVNHLDKIQYMTENKFQAKVIIRTSIGAKFPLDGGIQHTRDYTQMMKDTLTEVDVVLLNEPEEIFPAFKRAYNNTGSTMIIEWGDYYNEK